jgi:3D (Asp-Asp-Asp) domain-containing protein
MSSITKESALVLNEAIETYYNSEEYKIAQFKLNLENKVGFKIKEVQPITCKLTYYSSLASENGKYGMKTASGVMMNSQTVANNFLSFGTDLYMEGYGHKTVHDRGSNKHFNTVNRFDVYVPRNSGESDSAYYKRVNKMGRKTVTGYILIKE